MKTLITGASGFIGLHLVKRILIDEGEVRVLLRKGSSFPLLADKRIEIFYGDLEVKKSLRYITRGIDVVINAAGLMAKWGVSLKDLYQTNVVGVKNLIESCLASDINQLIHLSTCGVSGTLDQDGVAEEYCSEVFSPYEQTKAQGEKYLLKTGLENKMHITVIRPTFTYGPGDLHRLSLYRRVKKKFFIFIGKGQGTLHPVYIDDLVQGIMLSKNLSSGNSVYIIGGETITSIKELVFSIADALEVNRPCLSIPVCIACLSAMILEKAGKLCKFEPPLTMSRFNLFTKPHGYNINKAKIKLGYKPLVGLRQGLERTVQWYSDHGYIE